jgi:hypothetical protein
MGDDLRGDLSALTSQQITQRYRNVNDAIEDIRDVTILNLDIVRWGLERGSEIGGMMRGILGLQGLPKDQSTHNSMAHIMFLTGVDIVQTKKFERFFSLVQEYANNGKNLGKIGSLTPTCHIDNPLALLALSRIYKRGRSVGKDEQKASSYLITAKGVASQQLPRSFTIVSAELQRLFFGKFFC